MATGHYLGDTGTFSNTIYTGYPSVPAGDTVVPFIENDAVLGDVDEHFGGDYLNEETILKMARAKGLQHRGDRQGRPDFDVRPHRPHRRHGLHSIVIDDATGGKNGVPLSRGDEGGADKGRPSAGDALARRQRQGRRRQDAGHTGANTAQQAYFADVASKVVLPMFKARNKPFVLVFWSRDPDGSQHNHRRQPQHRDARHQRPDLARRHQERRQQSGAIAQGARRSRPRRHHQHHDRRRPRLLDDFEGKQDQPAAKVSYEDTPKDFLPMGFLAIDLAKALDLPLFDPNDKNARVADNAHPKAGNGVLGKDPAKPDLVVATNGGSDLIYLPNKDRKLAERTVKALLEQDYVSGLFVDDKLGRFPGTLPMSQLNLKGKAVTPTPSIVVNFRSYRDRMRRADQLLGRGRRYGAAAGPGHARQFRPRRHHEFHGGDRAGLQGRLCRCVAGQQCRRRHDHRGNCMGLHAGQRAG